MKEIIVELGLIAPFAGRFCREVVKLIFEFPEFARQCYYIGKRSSPLVAITTFIIGLVIAI